MLLLNNIKNYLYEKLYDIWMLVGVRMYFVDILLDTQQYVRYEIMMNDRKIRTRKDFKKMSDDYDE